MVKEAKRIIGMLIMVSAIILVGIVVPLTLGLGTGSLSDPEVANKIDFYQKFYWSLAIIIPIFFVLILIKKNNKYGDSIGFAGIKDKITIPFFRRFTLPQLTIASTIFFSIIFLIANFFELSGGFTGLSVLPKQSFTNTQSILFSTFVIPAPENLLNASIIAIYILILTLISIKTKLKKSDFLIWLFVGLFIIGATFGVLWHNETYPGSDTNKIIVGGFWGTGNVISISTGSFVPFWIMHTLNNFFIDFAGRFSNDAMLILMLTFIISLSAFYGWFYRGRLLGGKQKVVLLK